MRRRRTAGAIALALVVLGVFAATSFGSSGPHAVTLKKGTITVGYGNNLSGFLADSAPRAALLPGHQGPVRDQHVLTAADPGEAVAVAPLERPLAGRPRTRPT